MNKQEIKAKIETLEYRSRAIAEELKELAPQLAEAEKPKRKHGDFGVEIYDESHWRMIMDTEMIKEMTNFVNDVILATAKPYQEQIRQLKAENKRLREALLEYGSHGRNSDRVMCESDKHTDYPCTCGFEQALKG